MRPGFLKASWLFALAAFVTHTLGEPSPAMADGQKPIYRRVFRQGKKQPGDQALVVLGGNPLVTGPQYRDLQKAVVALLSRFPPDKHYFVGLGRDPAPIIAFLQNLGGRQLAINFPASSNNTGVCEVDGALDKYCRKLIPDQVLRSGRTIVFVDVTTSGRGLNYYVPKLAETPSLKHMTVKSAVFADKQWPIWNTPGKNTLIDTTAFPDVAHYLHPPYEDTVAEYPRHVPGHPMHPMSEIETSRLAALAFGCLPTSICPARVLPRRNYLKFQKALMTRMATDSELDGFLNALGGGLVSATATTYAAAHPR